MSNMVDNIKNWYMLLATIVIIILSIHTCTQKPCGADGEVISSTIDTTFTTNTIIENYKDSIDEWILHAYVEVPEITLEKEYVFINKPSEALGMDLSDTSVFYDDSNVYYYGKQDSSLKYDIKVTGPCKPDRVEIEYSILEKTIKDSTYQHTTDTITIKQVDKVRVNQLYYGPELIVYPNLTAAFLGVDWVSKKGFQVEVAGGYDFTNKAPMIKVGGKFLLTFRRKK